MLSYKETVAINYIFSSEKTNLISIYNSFLYTFIGQFLRFFRNMLGHLIFWVKPNKLFIPRAKIWFFYVSKNNFDSLNPIAGLLSDSILIRLHPKLKEGYIIPMFFAYLFSLLYFPVLVFYIFKSKGYQRKSFCSFFERYWLTFGYYYLLNLYLKLCSPKAVVVSNDHRPEALTLVLVAKKLKIPTFYIQHASVSERFPPLNFDYALLEGKDSLDKYSKCGKIRSKVSLIGMPKFDKYLDKINRKNKLKKIGMCINKLDSFAGISSVGKYIKDRFPEVELFLRPHPGDANKFSYRDFANKLSIGYSDPDAEDAFSFLERVDAIISCNSSILLEAALLNVYPIYYDFDNKKSDAYGYVKNGLADYVNDCEGLEKIVKQLIRNKPDIRGRTKYYCETIGTEDDGKSSLLAKEIILKNLVKNGK